MKAAAHARQQAIPNAESLVVIKGFLETSFLDWPGKVVAVVFLPRCNFRCPFCHNHTLVLDPATYQDVPLAHVTERLLSLQGWVDGVCITGGEPTLHPWLPSLVQYLRELGFMVKLDTNGYQPDVLAALMEQHLLDCVAMDVKAPLDPADYSRAAGVPVALDRITRSISMLMDGGIDYYFRTTVVPAFHREEDLLLMARQLSGASSLTLQNFDPGDPLDPGLREVSPYPQEWIERVQLQVNTILGSC
jgi:pyruvate formate lyase activating enzyme